MSKVFKFKRVDRVTKTLKKIFNDVKTEKKLLNEIGVFTRDRIKFQTRTGKRPRSGKLEKMPNLRDSSKNIRRGIADKRPGLVDPTFFDPDRSNATLTGQLLNALNYTIKKDTVLIFFKDRRTKKVNPDDTSSNNEVYKDLVKRGFGFLGLDEKGEKRVKKLVLDEFRRTIKKFFK